MQSYVYYLFERALSHMICFLRHHFHEECLKKWLQLNANCPICRTDLETLYGEKPPPNNSGARRRRRRRRRRVPESEYVNPDIVIHQNAEPLDGDNTEQMRPQNETNQITLPLRRNEHQQQQQRPPQTKSPTTLEIE